MIRNQGFSMLSLLPVTLVLAMVLFGTLQQTDRLIHASQWYTKTHQAQELAVHVAEQIRSRNRIADCSGVDTTSDGFGVSVQCHSHGDQIVAVEVTVSLSLPGLAGTWTRTAWR